MLTLGAQNESRISRRLMWRTPYLDDGVLLCTNVSSSRKESRPCWKDYLQSPEPGLNASIGHIMAYTKHTVEVAFSYNSSVRIVDSEEQICHH